MHKTTTNKAFTLKARLKSFKFAFQGIREVVATQHNIWIHLLLAILAISLGFVFSIKAFEWIAIVISIGIVFAAEIFNSALEYMVDMISPEHNEKAGKVKDMAAAAVFITALSAAIIGFIIFLPRILENLK
ncbi:MAG: diacylglycerol kinase [Bacteroidales bacterium]